MAATPALRRLTEAHRVAQRHIGALTVPQVRAVWPKLDPNDLDGTTDAWISAVTPIVSRQRAVSARTAAAYMLASKTLQLGRGTRVTPVLEVAHDQDALATSLLVTGPISIKRAMTAGAQLEQAVATANDASSASAMRYALNAGRDTVLSTIRNDRDARGWARVASGNACDFCSMLDGKVHRADDADFPAHDGCSCGQEPIYA